MNLDFWNNKIQKTYDTNIEAKPGDLVFYSYGIAYLIQRYNNGNNIIAIRVKKSKNTLRKSFLAFRRFCITNQIQYIRIEGSTRRYFWLMKDGKKLKGFNVVYDTLESSTINRNVFYAKLY